MDSLRITIAGMTLSLLILLVTVLLVALASWVTAWHMINSDTFAGGGRTTSKLGPGA